MAKIKLYLLALLTVCISLLIPITFLHAQEYVMPEPENEGAAEVTMYKADTVVIDSIINNDVVLMPHDLQELGKTTSVGIATHYSDYTKIYSLPVSYTFWSKLKLEVTVPYVYREIKNTWSQTTSKANGLGDIKTGATYLYSFSKYLESITSIAVTFPTGDAEKRVVDESSFTSTLIPLGNGSRSYSISQSFSYTIPDSSLRLYGSVLGVVYENATINSSELDRGNVYGGLAGLEYSWESIKGFVKINYIDVKESKIQLSGTTSWSEINDSVKASDVIVGVLYRVYSIIALKASLSIPVYTQYDKDLTDTPDRKWYINFSITSFF
ncbi:MAG: hypothetical protein WBK20_03315 [Spirochaetota bacterium]